MARSMNKRIQWSVPQLLDLERMQQGLSGKPSPILKAYKVWQQGGAPGMIIDRSARDCMDYRNLNHKTRHNLIWKSRTMRDFPLPAHAIATALEYKDCKEPTGHSIDWTEMGLRREYFRIMMPISGNRLCSVVRTI